MELAEGRRLVALRVPQGPHLADALHDLWERGDAVLPIPYDLPRAEARRILERMRPAAIVDDDGGSSLDDGEPVDPRTELVVLTSGSTGHPKGVELARDARRSAARLTSAALGSPPGSRWLCCVPMTRIAGLSILARSEVLGTEPVILERFDVAAFERASGCDHVSLVPTMLHRLLEAGVDLGRWRAILLGGGPAAPALVERARAAGANVIRTYGMTETCGGIVYEGRPLPGVEIAVDDGRISLKSPTVMERYRLDPELTRARLQHGWYRTGDVGAWDGTHLQVLGRADDAIVTGGEKVFPLEVERALLEHPDVVHARVFAEDDAEWGQRVVARVAARSDDGTLRAYLKTRLARHKVPARIEIEDVR